MSIVQRSLEDRRATETFARPALEYFGDFCSEQKANMLALGRYGSLLVPRHD
jgi:hypothetical protein